MCCWARQLGKLDEQDLFPNSSNLPLTKHFSHAQKFAESTANTGRKDLLNILEVVDHIPSEVHIHKIFPGSLQIH